MRASEHTTEECINTALQEPPSPLGQRVSLAIRSTYKSVFRTIRRSTARSYARVVSSKSRFYSFVAISAALLLSLGVLIFHHPVVLAASDTERIGFVMGNYLFPDTLNPNFEPTLGEVAFEGQDIGGSIAEPSEKKSNPASYVVESGDTTSQIAAKFNLYVASLLISNPGLERDKLMPGQSLKIPAADYSDEELQAFKDKQAKQETAAAKTTTTTKKTLASTATSQLDSNSVKYAWPIGAKKISQYFGSDGHQGIDIPAPVGSAVYAVADVCIDHADGTGYNGGFGKVIIARVNKNLTVYYAHLSKILVKTGDCVDRGTKIGESGNTGNSTGPHLHSEWHLNGTAVNPLKYLKK